MTQEEIESKIEYLLKHEEIFSKFLKAQSKINEVITEQLTNHAGILSDCESSIETLNESSQGLVQQDLNLLKMINVIKEYLEAQQKS